MNVQKSLKSEVRFLLLLMTVASSYLYQLTWYCRLILKVSKQVDISVILYAYYTLFYMIHNSLALCGSALYCLLLQNFCVFELHLILVNYQRFLKHSINCSMKVLRPRKNNGRVLNDEKGFGLPLFWIQNLAQKSVIHGLLIQVGEHSKCSIDYLEV